MPAPTPTDIPAKSARSSHSRSLHRVTPTPELAIDDALIRRFAAGDEVAFVELMARYRAKIFNVTLGLLRNRADAEEITQDTFIRAHRGLAKSLLAQACPEFVPDVALGEWFLPSRTAYGCPAIAAS